MINITVRNIQERIHKKLKQSLKLYRRIINSEIIAYLEEALFTNKLAVERILAKSKEIRNSLNFEITLDELEEAKSCGRI